ncbi:MAG: tRNA (adenosine(37)-N6)-threonylcarbamoyltransferase complex transferase subunit TsaD [Candidatus Harrisonbacteria bacterium]|nr:tRNA (adenosine(37)-N6)-threonylcarbamoyltransferase complex transferase subunit TsaD [Candidatus Harrisonbacteria bacterium]
MRILSIETSCDDTALSLVECSGGIDAPRFVVKKNIVSSQIATHRPFGGVVPNLAKREHIKNLPKLFKKMALSADDIDAVAVTVGPGLAPALWTGVNFAQELSEKLEKPLLGANHLKGHLYSVLLPELGSDALVNIKFPAIALLVSGGHTILARLQSLTKIEKLGQTRDDAVGEAFDKVGKLIGLEYPGGPEIEKLALKGEESIEFPRPMIHEPGYDFSFSGLKTAVLYHLRDNPQERPQDVAASFQEAAIEVLEKRSEKALGEHEAHSLILCGGVAANKALQKRLAALAENQGVAFHTPSEFVYNTDNAAMIAAGAYIDMLLEISYPIEAQPNLNL